MKSRFLALPFLILSLLLLGVGCSKKEVSETPYYRVYASSALGVQFEHPLKSSFYNDAEVVITEESKVDGSGTVNVSTVDNENDPIVGIRVQNITAPTVDVNRVDYFSTLLLNNSENCYVEQVSSTQDRERYTIQPPVTPPDVASVDDNCALRGQSFYYFPAEPTKLVFFGIEEIPAFMQEDDLHFKDSIRLVSQ